MALALVAASNLGTDFDLGSRTANKIGVSWAISPTWTGSHTFRAAVTVAPAANYQIVISYNNASGDGFGIIQSAHAGVVNTPLQINPNGGQVQIGPGGLTAPTPVTSDSSTNVATTACVDAKIARLTDAFGNALA